jgi:hypothetical protein
MISGKNLFRICLLLMVLVCGVTTVSAWTLKNWSATVQTTPAQPGSPVSVHYDIGFDSYMTGTTFDASDSLVMYTDLASPQWTVTMIETQDDGTTVGTSLPVRQSMQVRLDGWSLSFARKTFDLDVQLKGQVPPLNQSQVITLVSLQEKDADAQTVSGSLVKKTLPITVQTPVPVAPQDTPAPAITRDAMTLQQTSPAGTTPPATITPTRKQTYSPGPDPLLACGMLAGFVVLWARKAHRK